MFMVLLRFADRMSEAPRLMEAHNAWLQRGFDDGVFLAAGSLRGAGGGAILAHAATLAEMTARVDADPFVAEGVVAAEIHEIAPSRTDPRLDFLNRAA